MMQNQMQSVDERFDLAKEAVTDNNRPLSLPSRLALATVGFGCRMALPNGDEGVSSRVYSIHSAAQEHRRPVAPRQSRYINMSSSRSRSPSSRSSSSEGERERKRARHEEKHDKKKHKSKSDKSGKRRHHKSDKHKSDKKSDKHKSDKHKDKHKDKDKKKRDRRDGSGDESDSESESERCAPKPITYMQPSWAGCTAR